MADFIGASGGLLMIGLIVVLFWRFILDLNFIKSKSAQKNIVMFAVAALSTGLLQIIIGAYIYSFVNCGFSVFNIQEIWNMEPIASSLASEKGYNVGRFLDQGILPLYPILTSVSSKILFDKFNDCSFYISLLSGVIGGMATGCLFHVSFHKDSALKFFMLYLCLPGSFFLFLPSPFALFMMLFSLMYLSMKYDKTILSFIFAVLCCITHLSGLAVLAMCIVHYLLPSKKEQRMVVGAATFGIVQLVVIIVMRFKGWGTGFEYLFVYTLPITMLIGTRKVKLSYEVYRFIQVGIVILSGFYLVGKIYNAF